MRKGTPLVQKILFGFFGCVMLLPLTQQLTHFVGGETLYGDVRKHENVAFTWAGWWTGSYQEAKELYLRDSVGFEPDFIKLNNELDFTLFNAAHSENVHIGSRHHYFGAANFSALCGGNFKGSLYYDTLFRKIAYVRSHLNQLGKEFVFIVGANPARTFAKELPPQWRGCKGGDSTNLAAVHKMAACYSVPLLDGSTWFAGIQDTARCKPMAPRAFHWTLAGAALITDSLQRRLQAHFGQPLVEMVWGPGLATTEPRAIDNDLELGLNLARPTRQDFTYCYPDLSYLTENRKGLKMTFVADSYFWTILYEGIPDRFYDDWAFANYNNEVWRKGQEGARTIEEDRFYERWQEADVIVILCGELNLTGPGWGFIDRVYEQLKSGEDGGLHGATLLHRAFEKAGKHSYGKED